MKKLIFSCALLLVGCEEPQWPSGDLRFRKSICQLTQTISAFALVDVTQVESPVKRTTYASPTQSLWLTPVRVSVNTSVYENRLPRDDKRPLLQITSMLAAQPPDSLRGVRQLVVPLSSMDGEWYLSTNPSMSYSLGEGGWARADGFAEDQSGAPVDARPATTTYKTLEDLGAALVESARVCPIIDYVELARQRALNPPTYVNAPQADGGP